MLLNMKQRLWSVLRLVASRRRDEAVVCLLLPTRAELSPITHILLDAGVFWTPPGEEWESSSPFMSVRDCLLSLGYDNDAFMPERLRTVHDAVPNASDAQGARRQAADN
jgi:hypothetical protein